MIYVEKKAEGEESKAEGTAKVDAPVEPVEKAPKEESV
jgi:hypothetical protein